MAHDRPFEVDLRVRIVSSDIVRRPRLAPTGVDRCMLYAWVAEMPETTTLIVGRRCAELSPDCLASSC